MSIGYYLLQSVFDIGSDRSRRIVQMARKYNLLVVCDDVYNLLTFSEDEESAEQRKRLFAYDDP